jgi:hypothetical protein
MMDPAKGTSKGEAQPPLHEADLDAFSAEDTLDLFLLAGQSNMKGRATIPMEPQENSNILFLHSKELNWYVARDPLHAQGVPDLLDGSDNSGTGPGMTFARSLMASNPDIKIGLIPAAVGGAPIDSFGPDGELYSRSLLLTKKAIKDSPTPTRLKAILWLQGESDAMEERYQSYEGKLLNLVHRFRADLNNPTLPFIACTIGSFIYKGPFQYAKKINDVLLSLPQKCDYTACVDARDLKGHIGDAMHYDIESQLEIGKRFADAYRLIMDNSE